MNTTRGRGLVLTAVVALGLVLAGCGGSSSSSGKQAASGGSSSPSVKLKIGMLVPGSTNDQGYNADAARTADLLRSSLGATVAMTPVTNLATQNDVYQQFAAQGNDVVIGWGGQFTNGAVAVAPRFPKVKFICVNCTESNGKNLASVNQNSQEWSFVAGYVMAKLSKTPTVGLVGSQCFPGTALTINGNRDGAKYANPNEKVLITYTGDFENPTLSGQAASAMISQGAGALGGNMNNAWFGVFKAAQSGGKVPVITEWADNHQLAPDVIASTVLKSQAKFVTDLVKKVQDGSLEGKVYDESLTADWGPAISKTALLPDALYKEAMDLQQKIIDKKVAVKADPSCPNQ